MKKLLLILSSLCLLFLAACGASNAAAPASASQAGSSTGALPAVTQLIVGTLKLDGTAQAVTAEQAAELLPLWQTMLVLVNSDTAAAEEKEALIAQIGETMTAEQTQAIRAMNLTPEDVASVMQQGTAMGNSQSSGSSSRSSGGGFGPGAGEFPRGDMPPGGGPGGFGGQNMNSDQIATAQAARQTGHESFASPVLLKAVIEYLQEKAA